jgi:hypothetical protein
MFPAEDELSSSLEIESRDVIAPELFIALLSESLSFKGLGPELHDLIAASNSKILDEPDEAQKLKLTQERSEILKSIFQDGLIELYGDEEGKKLTQKIFEKINKIDKKELVPQKTQKKEVCCIVYPDTFGDINGLIKFIPKLEALGVTKLHILPFFDNSGDKGFATRIHSLNEPLKMRNGWTLEQFQELVIVADEHGINLLVDVVLNHISIDSPLLEDPEIGEQLLKSWTKDEVPFEYLGSTPDLEKGGSYANYRLKNGTEFKVLIMFSEQTKDGDDPLLVTMYEGTEDEIEVFHTFYDFQVDLDFSNPKTFELVAGILEQIIELIGRKGQLRLDAIPFIGKDKKIDWDIFRNMDNDDGYKIITLIKILTTLFAPDLNLIAEASRPLKEIGRYLKRVGGAYDFISLPYFLLAITEDNPALFLDKIDEMVKELGLEEFKKLVMLLQSHDDFPIAELGDSTIAKRVWTALKRKKAFAFGTKPGGEDEIPKGAAVRFAEICDNNPEKIAATIALASFTPHGDLFFLFGTETGLRNSQEALAEERKNAADEGRRVDTREVIREKLDVDEYLTQIEDSETFEKISKVLQLRKEFLPEKIIDWQQKVVGGLVDIDIVGESGADSNQQTYIKVYINYSTESKVIGGGQRIEAWGYKVVDLAGREGFEPH